MSVSPVEMIGLVERTVRLALHVAQVDEMDARREFLRHRHQIVLRVRAERAGAQREPAGLRRHAANSLRTSSAVDITRGRPKIGKDGSSGWMREPRALLLGDRR